MLQQDEERKLNHDFMNSITIINSISKSASSFIDKIVDERGFSSDKKIELFKQAMLSVQHEVSKIEVFFNRAMNR